MIVKIVDMSKNLRAPGRLKTRRQTATLSGRSPSVGWTRILCTRSCLRTESMPRTRTTRQEQGSNGAEPLLHSSRFQPTRSSWQGVKHPNVLPSDIFSVVRWIGCGVVRELNPPFRGPPFSVSNTCPSSHSFPRGLSRDECSGHAIGERLEICPWFIINTLSLLFTPFREHTCVHVHSNPPHSTEDMKRLSNRSRICRYQVPEGNTHAYLG